MTPDRATEICRMIGRLEKETYDAWLERTRLEAAERAEKAKGIQTKVQK